MFRFNALTEDKPDRIKQNLLKSSTATYRICFIIRRETTLAYLEEFLKVANVIEQQLD